MAYLLQTSGQGSGAIYELSHGKSVIGRHPGCKIAVQDASVSRKHTLIDVDMGVTFLEDLESRNGTILNDERLSGRKQLTEGDTIQLGKAQFYYCVDYPSQADKTTALSSAFETKAILPRPDEKDRERDGQFQPGDRVIAQDQLRGTVLSVDGVLITVRFDTSMRQTIMAKKLTKITSERD